MRHARAATCPPLLLLLVIPPLLSVDAIVRMAGGALGSAPSVRVCLHGSEWLGGLICPVLTLEVGQTFGFEIEG